MNLFFSVVLSVVSRWKHHRLSTSCSSTHSSSGGGFPSILGLGSTTSPSLRVWAERVKVQGLVFKRSFNVAEHPPKLHTWARRVAAKSREERRGVVVLREAADRHDGLI